MRSIIFLYVTIVIVSITTTCQGQSTEDQMEWMVTSMPDPMKRPKACGRNAPSFVCDPENILPLVIANEIDELLQSIYNSTTVPCYSVGPQASKRKGYLVMLAVIPKMKKYFTQKAEDNMVTRYLEGRSFAYHLGTNLLWGNHSSNCNETVIILYSKKDFVLYTSTQSTARRKLNDLKVRGIMMDTLTRYFPFTASDRRAATAIKYMVTAYRDILNSDEKAQQS